MRKIVLAFASATALAISSAAGAAVTVDSTTMVIDGPATVADTTTIGFTEANLSSPTFVEDIIFTNTLAGLYTITLTTSSPAVDFTSALVTGAGGPYNLVEIDDNGISEFWRLANPITLDPGQYTLTVNGNNSGVGSLGGSITIRSANAVPEPATWGMMLLGFGAAGYAMRRSRRRRGDLLQIA